MGEGEAGAWNCIHITYVHGGKGLGKLEFLIFFNFF